MRRIMATGYRLFETVYRPLIKRQALIRPLKKGSVVSPETSANTFLPNPHNNLEERSPHIREHKSANSFKRPLSVHMLFQTFSKLAEIISLKATNCFL